MAEVSGPSPACRSLRAVGQPRPAVHRPCRSLCRGPAALLAAARGPDRPGCFVVFWASARADSRMGARACM
ncbi:MAG: hypothetical protein NTY37_10165 [Methanothrix sp.]|nr:hypothetical protein [Methanothrix sp.]